MSDTANSEPPSTSATVPPPTPSRLAEREWDKLLTLMGDGQLVPVIGPELLCVPWEERPAARLYDLWGEALAQRRGIEWTPVPDQTPLLYRIANQLSLNPEMQANDLEYEIDGVIRGQRWPLPESLRRLAEIRDFPLYVTTTIDHLMEAAFREARETREPPLQIVFKRGGNAVSNDLPKDFVPGERPVVFHLFGATCTDPDGFAATEDALIEFSWALIDQEYAPKRLYDFLRGKTILLLGCDFPDWLERFFIHALTRKPDAHIAVNYVSGCDQSGLRDFLRRRRAHLLPPQSPVDFVAELHQRWRARQRVEQPVAVEPTAAPIPGESKHGAVFLSYSREDRAAAAAIRAQLEAANIDTWMDESELEPGAKFQEVIRKNIEKASFFVAIISRALDLRDSDRLGRFVLREWRWAADEDQERPMSHGFLRPVVVDDTSPDADFIDRPFREAQWTYVRDGKLPPEFIESLQRGIRRFRSKPGGANA